MVCINLSAALSATMQSAATAAKSLEGEVTVTVVDSKALTLGLGNIVVAAAEAAERGAGPAEIVALVERPLGPHPDVGAARTPSTTS